MLTLLVTGFGPFPGAPTNPSSAIVEALGRAPARRLARLGVKLVTARLPVVFAELPIALAALLAETKPDAILHIGLAGRRKKLGVELKARNRLTRLFPDAARALPAARHVVAQAPEFRRARLPVAQLARVLGAEISRDAGAYVCNQTLYLSLGEDIPLVGFVHIPRPRGRRPLARVETTRIPLQHMTGGIEDALIVIAREARRALMRGGAQTTRRGDDSDGDAIAAA
jgi:pyroglutamyl-peptidase